MKGGKRRRGGTPSRSKKRIVSAENSLRSMSQQSNIGRVRVNANISAPKGWKSKGSMIQHTAKRGIWRR